MRYCPFTFKTERWKTREVMVGNVGVGAANPVRIQSMTTSNTRDAQATAEQVMRLADVGCEIARVTVQGIKEADACEQIKNLLLQKGYSIPLVADIHFYPPAAFRVVDFVDKVRINPGNFVDKRASFKVIEYDDALYAQEIAKITEKFTPLVLKCKALKRAMRIGTNHGSLSDRIMNRYGDTPRGMIEAAFEFARICRQNDYHDFIFSMKSSNPQVMIQAYRLLVAEMMKLGWDYPLHLGVTEAGEGEDGRIKSAMGIGSLLLDGLGDTIRVSLTEDPWLEIDPCQRLVNIAQKAEREQGPFFAENHRPIEDIQRRKIILPKHFPLHRDGGVWVSVSAQEAQEDTLFKSLGAESKDGELKINRTTADIAVVEKPTEEAFKLWREKGLSILSATPQADAYRLIPLEEALDYEQSQRKLRLFDIQKVANDYVVIVDGHKVESWMILEQIKPACLALKVVCDRLHVARRFFAWLEERAIALPVMLHFSYDCPFEDLVLQAAAECGSLLTDGKGDGLWLTGPYELSQLRSLQFNILQAARRRITKTDFISCPSCGRTLFDLQEVTRRIHVRTAHLAGVKIAIMGCIVNGPGEMADADFGYVGSRPGMIDLYVGKTCVEPGIPFAEADDRLVALIQAHGRWEEPVAAL